MAYLSMMYESLPGLRPHGPLHPQILVPIGRAEVGVKLAGDDGNRLPYFLQGNEILDADGIGDSPLDCLSALLVVDETADPLTELTEVVHLFVDFLGEGLLGGSWTRISPRVRGHFLETCDGLWPEASVLARRVDDLGLRWFLKLRLIRHVGRADSRHQLPLPLELVLLVLPEDFVDRDIRLHPGVAISTTRVLVEARHLRHRCSADRCATFLGLGYPLLVVIGSRRREIDRISFAHSSPPETSVGCSSELGQREIIILRRRIDDMRRTGRKETSSSAAPLVVTNPALTVDTVLVAACVEVCLPALRAFDGLRRSRAQRVVRMFERVFIWHVCTKYIQAIYTEGQHFSRNGLPTPR
jgi:hypothetical protein